MNAISLQGLTKRYGRLTAVGDLSLEAKEGEVLGFLGLNGAGKTTTIRVLLDLLRPTSGKASVFGYDCQGQGLQARSLVGYLPGELGIYSDLNAREVLDLLARLDKRPVDRKYRRAIQERLDFPDAVLHRKLREYSTGMKRKLGLIQAFQGDPRLLILDEPTEGLDPLMQESFYQLVGDVRQRGRTIFMSSHVLSEVERVCDRIAILRKGELVLFSTIDQARSLAARKVQVLFNGDVEAPADLPPGYKAMDLQPRVWTLRVEGELGPLVRILAELPVKDMQVEQPRLEDILVKYYREDAP